MFSATGLVAAFAILALSVNVIDTEPAPPNQAGATHVVAADGTGEFSTIGAAVDAAEPGDTISIAPGTYTESVLVDKDLAILGGGSTPAEVTVRIPDDGPTRLFEGMTLQYGFWFEDAEAEIANLAIEGPDAGVSALVAVGGDLNAHDLTEDLDPYASWPYGFLYMTGDATGTIEGNTSKAFVWLDGAAAPVVRRNTIHNVIRSDGDSAPLIEDNDIGGVWAYGNAEPLIKDNLIDFSNNGRADGGFSTCGVDVSDGAARPTVVGNEILNAPTGICATAGVPTEITGNTITDSTQDGIWLSGGDTAVTGNTITGGWNGIQLGAGSPTITGNTIDVGHRGISVTRHTAVVEGNSICGADTSIFVVPGAGSAVGDNDVC